MSDKIELLPCPFCGATPEIIERKCDDACWAVVCRNQLCFLFVPKDAYKRELHNYTTCFTDFRDMVGTWNTRNGDTT